ncbi:MAG: hypothetical protein V4819_07260 [Verrucomicrobiota bacterium]
MKIEEVTVPPATEPGSPDSQRLQPPVREPDRDEKEYLEWRQELL